MKIRIIDILDKMADGTLEDGFKFKYKDGIYKYFKNKDKIWKEREDGYETMLGDNFIIERDLTDEVEVIEDVKEIEEIKPLKWIDEGITQRINPTDIAFKVDELVQAVNELRKEKRND